MAMRKISDYFTGQKPHALRGGAGKKERIQYHSALRLTKIGHASEEFTSAKQVELARLKKLLALSSGVHAIRYPMRNALSAINALPFAYTLESSHTQFGKYKGRSVSLAEAGGMHKVVLYAGYLDFLLDTTHPRGPEFLSALKRWQQQKFPTARILQYSQKGTVKIGLECPRSPNKYGFIHGSEVEKRLAHSHKFIKELTGWVKRYRAKKK